MASKKYIEDELDPYGQMMMDDLESGNDDELYLAPASVRYEFDQDDDDMENVISVDVDEDFASDYDADETSETIPMAVNTAPKPTRITTIGTVNSEYEKQKKIGVLVELEHVHNWSDNDPDIDLDTLENIASMIADDHLKVTPDYYTKLIRAGLVDEQDAIDLHDSMYGKETKKPSSPPLPKTTNTNRPKTTAYQSDFKMTLEPTTSSAKIQPERVSENKKKTVNEADQSYESMLTDNTDYTNENLSISTSGISLDDGIDFADVEVW